MFQNVSAGSTETCAGKDKVDENLTNEMSFNNLNQDLRHRQE